MTLNAMNGIMAVILHYYTECFAFKADCIKLVDASVCDRNVV